MQPCSAPHSRIMRSSRHTAPASLHVSASHAHAGRQDNWGGSDDPVRPRVSGLRAAPAQQRTSQSRAQRHGGQSSQAPNATSGSQVSRVSGPERILLLQGLNPLNMFGCGIDFLLRLNPVLLEPYAEQYAMLAEPAALKIGIHIRVGDNQLVRRLNNVSDMHIVTTAAHQHFWHDWRHAGRRSGMRLRPISQTSRPGSTVRIRSRPSAGGHQIRLGLASQWHPRHTHSMAGLPAEADMCMCVCVQVVRWFLATDSLALRHQAKAAYGDKLVTELHPRLGHTRAEHTRAAALEKVENRNTSDMWVPCFMLQHDGGHQLQAAATQSAVPKLSSAPTVLCKPCRIMEFQSAAVEMWLLSLTDYQVRRVLARFSRQIALRLLIGHVDSMLGEALGRRLM
jgi:hypothetical protein